jgi:curved DNA-binding protein CbpA
VPSIALLFLAGRAACPLPSKVLGISTKASTEEVRSAYKRLAFQLHPDRNKAEDAQERFSAINEAHEVLSDNAKRRQYDLTRGGGGGGGGGGWQQEHRQWQEQRRHFEFQFQQQQFHRAQRVSEGEVARQLLIQLSVIALFGWMTYTLIAPMFFEQEGEEEEEARQPASPNGTAASGTSPAAGLREAAGTGGGAASGPGATAPRKTRSAPWRTRLVEADEDELQPVDLVRPDKPFVVVLVVRLAGGGARSGAGAAETRDTLAILKQAFRTDPCMFRVLACDDSDPVARVGYLEWLELLGRTTPEDEARDALAALRKSVEEDSGAPPRQVVLELVALLRPRKGEAAVLLPGGRALLPAVTAVVNRLLNGQLELAQLGNEERWPPVHL